MKKSFTLALVFAALMLVTVMAVSVSAAPSITLGDVTVVKDVDKNLVTFTVPYTAVEVDQVTLIATKGGNTAAPTPSESNIVYISQQKSSDAISFTFSVNYDKFSADAPYCWIKVGGTSIETAVSAGGEEIWATTSVLVYGDVNDDDTVSSADTVLINKYIAASAVGDPLDTIEFPNGTFPVGSTTAADVNVDGTISSADTVLINKFIAANAVGDPLDTVEFPSGKFPAESK